MTSEELRRLKYRRQYLLVPTEIQCPFDNIRTSVNDDYVLYTHIDLTVSEYQNNETKIIMLGDIFDYESPQKNNKDILCDLFDKNYNNLLSKISKYSGRYVIIFVNGHELNIVHDATSARKIYYCQHNDNMWCSSQTGLLAKILDLKKTINPSKIAYYNSDVFKKLDNSDIGDTTIYDDIHQVLPNHYLDLKRGKVYRYWPDQTLHYSSVDSIAESIAEMVKGFIESINNRFKIMLPVTAGKDSRTLFSATRDIKDNVFYYINKMPDETKDGIDIKVPNKLLTKLGLTFHIIESEDTVDEDFRNTYYENFELASELFLPIIYNYYVNFSDWVNVPGMFVASAYELYGHDDKNVEPHKLSRANWVQQFDFAQEYYEKWLKEVKDQCYRYNFNIFALFYWEERVANWGTQIQQYKDIAQEEYIPFNSRQLIKYCYSVKPKYLDKPNYILYKRIMNILWPDTLSVPINPDFKHKIYRLLSFLGIMEMLRKMKHRLTNLLKH